MNGAGRASAPDATVLGRPRDQIRDFVAVCWVSIRLLLAGGRNELWDGGDIKGNESGRTGLCAVVCNGGLSTMASDDTTKQSVVSAWEKAENCSALGNEAHSRESRALYRHLRNSWIEIANNLQLLGGAGGLGRNRQIRTLLKPRINGQRRNRGHLSYSAASRFKFSIAPL